MDKIIFSTLCAIFAFVSSPAKANSEYYLECNACSSIEMKIEAQSAPFVGSYATAHVFNESDMRYERYRIFREIVGSGEEAMTQVSSFLLSPNPVFLAEFQDMVIAKQNLEADMSYTQLVLHGDGSVSFYQQAVTPDLAPQYFGVNSAPVSLNSINDPGCDGRGPARETSASERTAHDYLRNSVYRQNLFNAIKQEFDVSGVGNMTEFFDKNKKLFDSLAATGVIGISQAGATLSVIGGDATRITTVTPDNGKMEIVLDFNRTSANVVWAKDGDCNEIPLDRSDFANAEFIFSSLTGEFRMHNRLSALGANITGSLSTRGGFYCASRQSTCITDPDGSSRCTKGACVRWVRAD